MGAERWLCSSCGAGSDPASGPPPGCARCDAPLHLGKFGLIELLAPEQSIRVFRGRESSGSRQVTIRLLPENLSSSLPALRQALKRFASFSHPSIAAPLEAGIHGGKAFVAEEFVPGEAVTRADLTLREGMGVMRDVALAIGAAHDRGVVHPDLRPDCLKVVRGPGKTPTDYGWRVSVTGFVGPGEGSVRANLHALGTILYAVATGRPPGTAAPSSLNPLIDTPLESIIGMAMDSEASHQPPGAEEIATELTRWLKGNAPSVRPATIIVPPSPKQTFDWSRIRPEARIAAAISLGLFLLILFMSFWKSGSPAPEVEPKPVVAAAPVVAPPPVEQPPAPVEPPKLPPPPPPVEPPKPAPPPAPVEPPQPPPPPLVEPPKPPPPPPVEAPKPPPPPPVEAPKPPPPPKAPAARSVGVIQSVHPEYGLFVKLEGGTSPAAGDELEAVRDGKGVARLTVERLTGPEKRYPQGCAICKLVSGRAAAGDAVRRVSK